VISRRTFRPHKSTLGAQTLPGVQGLNLECSLKVGGCSRRNAAPCERSDLLRQRCHHRPWRFHRLRNHRKRLRECAQGKAVRLPQFLQRHALLPLALGGRVESLVVSVAGAGAGDVGAAGAVAAAAVAVDVTVDVTVGATGQLDGREIWRNVDPLRPPHDLDATAAPAAVFVIAAGAGAGGGGVVLAAVAANVAVVDAAPAVVVAAAASSMFPRFPQRLVRFHLCCHGGLLLVPENWLVVLTAVAMRQVVVASAATGVVVVGGPTIAGGDGAAAVLVGFLAAAAAAAAVRISGRHAATLRTRLGTDGVFDHGVAFASLVARTQLREPAKSFGSACDTRRPAA
jgi:hypothetical protein